VHAAVGGVLAPPLAPRDVPGVADHQLEVVVVVDGRTAVGVVLLELVDGDYAVLLVVFAAVERI
jgi:hypothetical protein